MSDQSLEPQQVPIIEPVYGYEVMTCDNEKSRDVYLIRCTETGRIKIGVANEAAKRIAEIQRMSPTAFEVLAVMKSLGNNLETFLHRKYLDYRIHGEWFEPDEEMLNGLSAMLKDYWENCEIWFEQQGNRQDNAKRMRDFLEHLVPIKPFVKPVPLLAAATPTSR